MKEIKVLYVRASFFLQSFLPDLSLFLRYLQSEPEEQENRKVSVYTAAVGHTGCRLETGALLGALDNFDTDIPFPNFLGRIQTKSN